MLGTRISPIISLRQKKRKKNRWLDAGVTWRGCWRGLRGG